MASALERVREAGRVVWKSICMFIEIDGEQRAASFAYYALFSLFPLFALLLTVGSAIFAPSEVIQTIGRYFPLGAEQQNLVWQMVASLERSRGSIGLVSVVILLWCSLRFFQALVRGVNRAWHTIEIPWWQMPIKNLLMIAVIASALLIGIVAPAMIQAAKKVVLFFQDFLEKQVPGLNLDMVGGVFDWSRYVLAGAVLFYAFTLLYMLAPRRRVYFRQVWMPALFVSLALQFCQNAFVNYLPRFVNYNAIYGTVGGLMLLLLWVYLSGVIIFFGACLCAAASGRSGADEAEKSVSVTPSIP